MYVYSQLMLFVRRALSASNPLHRSLPSLLVRASPRLTLPLPLSPALRSLSTSAQQDARDAYEVLGVQKSVNADDLTAIYKTLAREHHPDRHQGDARAAAEARFQVCARPRPRGQTRVATPLFPPCGEGSRHTLPVYPRRRKSRRRTSCSRTRWRARGTTRR